MRTTGEDGAAPMPEGASGTLPRPTRVVIAANPVAGGYSAATIEAVLAALRAGGAEAELRLTTAAGDMRRIAADPLLGADILAVAGGDGSINEAVSGLMERVGRRPVLAVVPAGTANVLAYELGLPRRPAAIARAILAGRSRRLHTGRANGRPFLLMVSAGFDAEVVHRVPADLKRRFKQLAFVATAFRHGFGRVQPDIAVTADGERLTGRLAIVTKASCYGGPFRISRDVASTEPGLALILVRRDDPWSLMRLGAALLTGRLASSRRVEVRRVTRVRFDADAPVPVQLDGEAFGYTPVEIETGDDLLAVTAA